MLTIRATLKGYTLIELLLVIAIVGMAIALVIPSFSHVQTAILKAQTREIVAFFKQARRTAIMEGRQVIAVLQSQPATNHSTTHSKTWVSDAEIKLQWADTTHSETVTAPSEKVTGGYQFTFFPEGGGSGGELILSYKDQRVKIKVNPLTGKIETEFLNREIR
jgi:general secretion pathway protein H